MWRALGQFKLAGLVGGGVAAIVAVLVLLLVFSRCFSPAPLAASVRSTPTPANSAAPTPTVQTSPSLITHSSDTPTPTQSATQAPTPTPTDTPSPSPDATPTSTPTTAPTSTPTPGPPVLTIASLPWHQGEQGVAYSPVNLVASGGTPPYHWSISSGALPGGLALTNGGTVSGTPNAAGGPFTVHVDDSAGQAAAAGTAINIADALAVNNICFQGGCTVEAGCSICGLFGTQSGGVGPYSYQLTAGLPPKGTNVDSSSLSLVGQITTSGGPFSVEVTDALGAKQSASGVVFNAFPHVFVLRGTGGGPTNGPARVTLSYAGGSGKITSVRVDPNPHWKTPGAVSRVSDDGSTLIIDVAGSFDPGSWTLQVTLFDGSPCGPAPGEQCSAGFGVPMSMG